jgi:hypothetical protein
VANEPVKPEFVVATDRALPPGHGIASVARALRELYWREVEEERSLAERGPDYLSFEDLLALDLTEDEARAVLAGQPQIHRDELADRLLLHRQERSRRLS